MNDEVATEPQHWTVDRKVPLALIATILLQTGMFVWWAASISERVSYIERAQAATAPQADRLTRVEVKLETVQEGIRRIEQLIQRGAAPP